MCTGIPGLLRSCFLSTFFLSIAAAADLAGHVRDPQQRPVPGATVSIFSRESAEAAISATTDASGNYAFHQLAEGVYLLRAEAVGFASFVANDVNVPGSGFDISLRIASVQQQVVVTASGTAQAPEEVARTVTVIDLADADNRDVLTLADAVSLAPGVRVQQSGGEGQLTAIRVRGMRVQDTSVLVDGMRLRDAGAPQGDPSGIVQDILFVNPNRIEVMNGAGSSLYGTTAIGGVVNILTDEGGGRTHGLLGVEGGSLGTVRGRAQLGGALLADHLQYSVGLTHVNVSSGVDGNDAFRDTGLQGRAGYRFSPAAQLSARLLAADSFSQQNSSPSQLGVLPATGIVTAIPFVNFTPGPNDPDSRRAGRFLAGALTLSGQPEAKLNYSLSFQTLVVSRRYNDGPGGVDFQPLGNTRTLYNGHIQTANGQVNYQFSRTNLLTAGYEFEHEAFANNFSDTSDRTAANAVWAAQDSHALFILDQQRFFDGHLILSGGFRAQYFSLDRPQFLPVSGSPFTGSLAVSPPAAYTGDGSVAYFFKSSGTKLRAHVGRGYRAPSLYERFGTGFDSFFGYSTYGDPRLQPEHSVSFDAGLEQTFVRGRAYASATYFYNSLDKTIGFATITGNDPFGRFLGYFNTNGGLSRGVELTAAASPLSWLTFNAAYTFVNANERTAVIAGIRRTLVIPRHQFSLTAVARAGKRTTFSLDTLQSGDYLAAVFSSSFSPTRAYQFDGVKRLNAQVSYRLPLTEFKALRLFVRGENLTDQAYYEMGFRTPGRTAAGGVRFEF